MKANWKGFSVIASAAAILMVTAIVVFSQQPPPPVRPMGAPPMGPMGPGFHPGFRGGPQGPHNGFGPLAGLNLTDVQQEQIRKIHETFAESTKQLHEQMRTLHQNQVDPLSGNFDEQAVRAAAESRAKLQVELEVLHAKMMSQVANVLTAEQRAQLAERHKQMRRMGPPTPPPDGLIN